jgi:GNAT superfamily N-acetyltransferase
MLAPEFNTKLKNGTEVTVRTVNSCDRQCISNEFSQLSVESRYSRFHTYIDKLTESQLTYLSDVDNINHVLITITKSVDNGISGLGLGRYIKLYNCEDTAEFAITVADKYQNQGVGSLLLSYLIEHAKCNGVSILQGFVLDSNKPMKKLLQKYNFKHAGIEDGLPRYVLLIDY